MTAPDITYRDYVTSFPVLASILYKQTSPSGGTLPVLQGQDSDPIYFRIYNNWALAVGVADAVNVFVTTYDGAGSGSHTYSKAPVSQTWIHMLENGYGANSVTPGVYTSFIGSDTAVGGLFVYNPEKGSDGVLLSRIRAGSNNNGVGFIEFKTYARVPSTATNNTTSFVVSVGYEWVS